MFSCVCGSLLLYIRFWLHSPCLNAFWCYSNPCTSCDSVNRHRYDSETVKAQFCVVVSEFENVPWCFESKTSRDFTILCFTLLRKVENEFFCKVYLQSWMILETWQKIRPTKKKPCLEQNPTMQRGKKSECCQQILIFFTIHID